MANVALLSASAKSNAALGRRQRRGSVSNRRLAEMIWWNGVFCTHRGKTLRISRICLVTPRGALARRRRGAAVHSARHGVCCASSHSFSTLRRAALVARKHRVTSGMYRFYRLGMVA